MNMIKQYIMKILITASNQCRSLVCRCQKRTRLAMKDSNRVGKIIRLCLSVLDGYYANSRNISTGAR